MKAVILAAGKGTRMRELTASIPKPMLKVHGKPILEHIVTGIIEAGIRDFCIITGFQAETIENYFGDGSGWGVKMHYVRQFVQDGTGKAPELAKDFLAGDDFLLTYGDILVKPETYVSMVKRFKEGEFSGLITVTEGQDVTKGAINFFDGAFCLKQIVEKPSAQQVAEFQACGLLKKGEPVWYNAGIYMFRSVLFNYTARLQKSPRGEYELPDAITAMLNDGRRIAGCKIEGRWVDVRDPEVLAELEKQS
jgi:UDP-N-acetylglucosamine diphosphorylase / glucose-1-phosphate thymidylyltransferase / UDP-N-acetylgalactosamine diphosphorylase / glucosamine-1-phosphate N-acetyltransferase / galactosamine-1-phosphate N-acetyltransferase